MGSTWESRRGYVNLLLFGLIFELFLLLVTFKAFHNPVTHDEAFTAIHYTQYSYWEIMMYPDSWPNNHILNTLLIKLFSSIFGMEQWAIRIPNLLAFLLYSFAIFRIVSSTLRFDSFMFLPASILFICNPYLLDFFSLARGYGLCIGLSTLSVSYLVTGIKLFHIKDLWLAFYLAILASYASFPAIIVFLAITIIVLFYLIIISRSQGKNSVVSLVTLCMSCIVYGLLILGPFLKMKKDNMFDLFTSQGFYEATMLSLTHNMVTEYPESTVWDQPLAIGLLLVVVINVVIVTVRFVTSKERTQEFRKPVWISSMVLILVVTLNFLEHILIKTPYLAGRIGLFYFPLFTFSLVCLIQFIDLSKSRFIKLLFSVVVSIALLAHLCLNVRLSYFREWWFDAHTMDVINFLSSTEKRDSVKLKAHWLFAPSLTFYKETGKAMKIDLLISDKNIDVNTDADYYYIFTEDYELLKSRFDPVWESSGRFMLVKAKPTTPSDHKINQ